MQKEIAILVGISASGKSTYTDAAMSTNPNSRTLNADTIRGKLYGNPMIQGDGNEVFGVLRDELVEMLKDDVTDYIIIDNTSLTCKLRRRYIDMALTICPEHGHEPEVRLYMFEPNLERSLEWNAKRDRNVPEDVIRRQFNTYEQPDEYEKLHCKIFVVKKS